MGVTAAVGASVAVPSCVGNELASAMDGTADDSGVAVGIFFSVCSGQIGCPVIRADMVIPIMTTRMSAMKITGFVKCRPYPDRLFSRDLAIVIVRSLDKPIVAWTLRCPAA